jgi:hypothetical protein
MQSERQQFETRYIPVPSTWTPKSGRLRIERQFPFQLGGTVCHNARLMICDAGSGAVPRPGSRARQSVSAAA